MLQLNVRDETSPLKAVVLGIANSPGPIPKPEEAYDPKSLEHILAGTYPREEDMIGEMEAFNSVLRKHGVKVFRPELLENCNQIFSRDIAFVIEDKLIKANILPEREKEFEAIIHVLDVIDPNKILIPPEPVHIEGGDVMPWKDYIFVGTYRGEDYSDYITARTNIEAVAYLKEAFPHKKIKSFDLRKSNTDPRQNALHLDCCFQPIGRDKAILHKNGFLVEEEYEWLLNYFGKDRVFEIDSDEMYQMFSNVFSISPEVIVSERSFTRLNNWLREQGFTVEEVPYQEIGKQEGLLRCSTLPLIRE
ncbi:MAG: amidinotransferase [Flavobacteriaceae bacterium]|nr:amidinotransferase [Muriicola sp.]NNL38329.1 amidinotransferase [Flavobacteriaceae bacterium]